MSQSQFRYAELFPIRDETSGERKKENRRKKTRRKEIRETSSGSGC